MKIHQIKQGSAEWYNLRLGKFTSSEIHKLIGEAKLKSKQGELTDTAKKYVLQKVHEVLTGDLCNSFENDATVWGVENENLARQWYSKINNVEVSEVGFTEISDSFGGSADGLTIDSGLEIKCPYNGAIHLEHCLIDSQEYFKEKFKDKYWQCVCNAFINNRKSWDFVSFDPRINFSSGFFCFRISPTEAEFELIANKVEQATKLKFELLNKFQN